MTMSGSSIETSATSISSVCDKTASCSDAQGWSLSSGGTGPILLSAYTSPTAKVLAYLDNHKTGLRRFLDDPRIPLDNNQCERGYCWVAVGRRSFFGSRSRRGTEVAAIFYSLAECARRVGVEPRAYFRVALAAALAGKTVPLPHELLPAPTSA